MLLLSYDLKHFSHNAGADSLATLTHVEAETGFDRNGGNKFAVKCGIVAWHDHLGSTLEHNVTRNVACPEEKLGTVVGTRPCIGAHGSRGRKHSRTNPGTVVTGRIEQG